MLVYTKQPSLFREYMENEYEYLSITPYISCLIDDEEYGKHLKNMGVIFEYEMAFEIELLPVRSEYIELDNNYLYCIVGSTIEMQACIDLKQYALYDLDKNMFKTAIDDKNLILADGNNVNSEQYLIGIFDIVTHSLELKKIPVIYNMAKFAKNMILDKLVTEILTMAKGIHIYYEKNIKERYDNNNGYIQTAIFTTDHPFVSFAKIAGLREINTLDLKRQYRHSDMYNDIFFEQIPDNEMIYIHLNMTAPKNEHFYNNLGFEYIQTLAQVRFLKGTKLQFNQAKNTIKDFIATNFWPKILNIVTTQSEFVKIQDVSNEHVLVKTIDKIPPASAGIQEIYGGKYSENAILMEDLILAIDNLISDAKLQSKPIVIYIPYGTNISSHDGSDILEDLINTYALQPGVTIITTAGEEGDKHHHARVTTSTYKEESTIRVSQRDNNIVGCIWITYPQNAKVKLISPANKVYDISLPKIHQTSEGTIFSRGNQISATNGSINILFRMKNVRKGPWKVEIQPTDGKKTIADIWLATQELNPYAHLQDADPFFTIPSIGNIPSLICVGDYKEEMLTITKSSGRGYTRDNRITPTFVSQGSITDIVSIYTNDPTPNTPIMSYLISEKLHHLDTVNYPNPMQGYGIYRGGNNA
ncbi:hypothetical protein AN639_10725 [Candidatus Epulonipiscium fishelsonii]|uniref:Uncharacterized protein n=1 Tax=Candidatus Epulonipiscium fishelsonii TaxID=77094 RepID=A0ACC8XFK3_9FIRM|nr:hypothetical protein AN396_00480 [Epulopiscium sp. SCG-B11WGA-EpuloA1]ONI43277.1 hypothetical protein AN639_10725 [Epulopiscium sp. SCG-B05WGA-EpuloA1]ONI47704.1 hypothetical protein AN644_04270 [Epulopiscium sp. SCG-C06WGA-EpuloA1]